MIPATNTARFNHLLNLARQCEKAGGCGYTEKQLKFLKLAAVYHEMAAAVMPSATDPETVEVSLCERSTLADKLRNMTTANGCTEAEAENAAQLLMKLEGGGKPLSTAATSNNQTSPSVQPRPSAKGRTSKERH
jgi:hypothetical protein